MILYYAPGACSLADHIALIEAGLPFDAVRVDLSTHRTADGRDFSAINPKGYVPALGFDSGDLLTENIAILAWIADQAPALAPAGELGRYRLLEMLAYISTEIHKGFKPLFSAGSSDEDRTGAAHDIASRLDYIAERLDGPFLFGDQVTVADAYLYVMLTWANRNRVRVAQPLTRLLDAMNGRASVQSALRQEGLA